MYISEVCAHNDDVIYDSVGFYHDFIVLTNGTDHVIDLSGYALSDDKDNLRKYVFPEAKIQSKERLIIWADVKTPFNENFADETAFYTGFRLSDHESLFLTDPDGHVLDSLRLPMMDRNQALLRSKAGKRGTLGTPQEMGGELITVSSEIKSPVLSVESGYYIDEFELTIDGGHNDVYYTTDGSNPCTSGVLYNDAIQIYDRSNEPNLYANIGSISVFPDYYIPSDPVDKATVVRAVARRKDGMFSEETVATFWVGQHLRDICEGSYTVSIVTDPEDLFSYDKGIYVTGKVWDMNRASADEMGADPISSPINYNMRGKGWRKESRLILFDPTGNCLYDETDTISIHGNFARSMNQKGFNLKPVQEGDKVFDGFFTDSGDTLMLRTGGSDDMSLTNFRDVLNNRVAQSLNIGAQQSVCCQVFLNGEYWGCYNLQEHPDVSFIEAHYQVPAEDINLIKNSAAVSGLDNDLEQYLELRAFVREHDFSDDLYYQQFCNMMDMDNLIDYYCMQIYCANSDAYDNNVALWKTRNIGDAPYADGKWRFLFFDTDMSLGSAADYNAVDMDTFVEGQCRYYNLNEERFFSNLIRNESFRQRFYNRFMELAENNFSYERVEPMINDLEYTYTKPMVLSLRRFIDPDFQESTYLYNVATVRNFYQERGGYICNYLKEHLSN
ncbi:MAG: CotH kinase family protein [Lachnospiraceae bacterium]|nr:CotH kinase family protein [Lachnospiraceae bacterium]